MDLKAKIKADIARHEVMACHDIQGALAAIDFVALSQIKTDYDNEQGYQVEGGVATIFIRGLLVPNMPFDCSDWGITGYNHISEYVNRADADSNVTQIVLDVDSGGGYVHGIDTACDAIYQATKPVEAFVSGDMYSAAYWLGATADNVTATKTSGIGSIGVLIAHFEHSKRLEKVGIKPTFIRSGKWKAVFNSVEPLTDEQKERLQQEVDETASIFFNHVAYCRDIEAKTIASWQGDTFNATQAKDLNLIDAIDAAPIALTNHNTQTQATTLSEEDTVGDQTKDKERIAELEAQLEQAQKAKEQAQAKLVEMQARQRTDAINALAKKTGKTYSDDEINAMTTMDETAFNFFVSQVTAKQSNSSLPKSLFYEQALSGRTASHDDLDANFNAWANS